MFLRGKINFYKEKRNIIVVCMIYRISIILGSYIYVKVYCKLCNKLFDYI